MTDRIIGIVRCEEHDVSDTHYQAAFADAEIRHRRGERQVRCAECELWVWPRGKAPTGVEL